jgi:2-polyprenyl-3-methyl-5-hydroxy-6-metoxy-1,4-benzoquinol methylase
MTDYTRRSYTKELLDGDNIPFDDIAENMKELEFINSYLGGHRITLSGFKKLAAHRKTISVCEIGCGGGDNLNALSIFCKKKGLEARLTGVDINHECIEFARKRREDEYIAFIHSDYRLMQFESRPDIIFSSLFCHHFTDDELVTMLQWMKQHAALGFFINDLHRHRAAHIFIKYATKIFSNSYLVKNDAPLSVLRGFTKKEWKSIFARAGISNYAVEWKWAFRHLVTSPAASKTKI